MSTGKGFPLSEYVSEELLMREPGDPVDADEELLLSGLVDSIGIMRLVGFIESDLNISIPPEDVTLENFSSVAAISAYLDGRTQ